MNAQLMLSIISYNEQNYNKAYEWFEKSAQQSDAEGQFNLGFIYAQGSSLKSHYYFAIFI